MLLDVILLSFLFGYLRGGRINKIPTFHKLSFLLVSILLQLASVFLSELGGVLVSIAYVSILAFFYANREHEDVRIFMIGWFLNALVIWANLGRMPVDLEQAEKLPFSVEPIVNGTDFKHTLLTDDTLLPFLADIMYMPFPIPRVISIGDLFIMLGAFLLVQRIMNKPISLIRLREGKNYAAKH
ncbi:DUF5317 domain-containing protein [Brevibacillus sp. H7]|uniref:DUF5317 domain-containing protein n=1 Tax=Brevibacillus sp. H7 TaxID=3349138 RepID=UPI00382C7957